MADLLASFHRALVEEIHAQRPDYLTEPFTVAEIYQNLVPYGTHRDRIGVEMNGDYEDTLLRLLAGEGDYLLLDSEAALRQIRRELETKHPNTGLYRDYAAVDVRLNPERLDASGAPTEAPVEVESLAPVEGNELVFLPERDEDADDAPEDAAADAPPMDAEAGYGVADPVPLDESAQEPAADDAGTCRWCRAELPRRDDVNFCPFCGTDVSLVPCGACGAELESGWRFCASCGTEVAG